MLNHLKYIFGGVIIKEFVVFTKKLKRILIESGFKFIREEPSIKNEGLNVYIFEYTKELKQFVDDYLGGK